MKPDTLMNLLDKTFRPIQHVLEEFRPELHPCEIGTVEYVGKGIARVKGLPRVRAEELVQFSDGSLGMVFNLDENEVGIILLDETDDIQAGTVVHRTGRVMDVIVGDALLGRVIDPAGRPQDEQGPIRSLERRAVEREARSIMERAPVSIPLQTGIKVIDALIPIGRGQRELILGDRQTGKTAIAVDTIINQADKNVLCVYCSIGQRSDSVARVIDDLRKHDAMRYTVIVATTGDDAPGLQFIAPYAATTIAEFFMEKGHDVLIVYDDLTLHARAYRELSLLLRRPPGREAFPGDIFYIHSRLLERSTRLLKEFGGGSLTAIPIIETEAQNISAYIPTNLISITDGQIYLSPDLFQKGVIPAVDVGKSVSRVGGEAQLPAYRAVAGDLRLSYSQFEELEAFSRFGTRLDENTRKILERGRRVREALKQAQYDPLSVEQQIAALLAVTNGMLDSIPIEKVGNAEAVIRKTITDNLPQISVKIREGKKLDQDDLKELLSNLESALNDLKQSDGGEK